MDSGKLLIAEPSIFGDQNFHRSIVIMVEKKKYGFSRLYHQQALKLRNHGYSTRNSNKFPTL